MKPHKIRAWFKTFLCSVFGHKEVINLYTEHHEVEYNAWTNTAWECTRCGEQWTRTWEQ